ncbi:MAG: DUF4258 domain-containing protein [Candidatus Schekmanbacteria bacterium]|nr:DUF4258 domain-containing protein [Candidatus Schekmanbacteria bacterium]
MYFEEKIFFSIMTPLNIEVRTTKNYWLYITTIKHPIMKGKKEAVKNTLKFPDEIKQSRTDRNVFLYYKLIDRLYCVVVKNSGMKGFIITAYPTEKVKEGDVIWTR